MHETKDTRLHCPGCGKTEFSQIQSGEIKAKNINFTKSIPFINKQKNALICVNCGFVINNENSLKTKTLLIVTGDSESYKSQAIITAGYKKRMEEAKMTKFTNFMVIPDHNIIFATISAMKKGFPPKIAELLERGVVEKVDCSDNKNYDKLIAAVNKHLKYYKDQKI